MRAQVCTKYGAPEVVQLQEVAMPEPKQGAVRIQVEAAVVGPSDSAFRQGQPFLVRLMYGLLRPKYAIMGTEFAGVVDAIGAGVTEFAPGQRAFGMNPNTFGAHGEYMCLPASAPVVRLPDAVAFEDAVSLADGPMTALTFLRDVAQVQPGQHVLVNGASGSVGAAGVQIAKALGAEVTGVCSGRNAAMVLGLGADHVIDYTQEDFTQRTATYDVIFDAVGKSSYGRSQHALKPQGIYLTTVPSAGIVFQMVWRRVRGGKRARFVAAGLMQNKANLQALLELHAAGKLRPVIDRRYPLEDIVPAYHYVETGRKRGSVVIAVA
jgi:NADPH:quinone reductase-like Zn-dependent oxidoreductase